LGCRAYSIYISGNKRFPGINTTYRQGTRSEIVTRTLTEFQGDQKSADVILSEGAPVVLRAAGAIEPYDTVQASALLLHDPTLPTVSLQIMALSYNTKKLKNEDMPKSWEDVVNSKYKGSVALDDPLRAGPLSGLLAGFKEYWKDDAKWARYIKDLKGLNVTVHKNTSAMFRLLTAGEYTIAMPALRTLLSKGFDSHSGGGKIMPSAPNFRKFVNEAPVRSRSVHFSTMICVPVRLLSSRTPSRNSLKYPVDGLWYKTPTRCGSEPARLRAAGLGE